MSAPNTLNPAEQINEMERIRLQTEYDRAALAHFQALPVGAPSLALGHPYPVNAREAELAQHLPHHRASVARMHSDLCTMRPTTRSALSISEDMNYTDANLRRMTKLEGEMRLHPCDAAAQRRVNSYVSAEEDRARRFDEYRALPARFMAARRDSAYTNDAAVHYKRNAYDRKLDTLNRAFLL
eukprot:TRINITY_DN8456_c0_g1_i2.p1 TRINITY_DN8456_c0_g1~~TRINITY_DN8456_c0_g1_i2.p1  ORF type:complete len:183 (-),score=40.73 TRINITY_DN8456_c0_g1_i2:189-737(-)